VSSVTIAGYLDDVQDADRLLTVLAGRHIGASRKHDAIQPLIDGAQPILILE